MSFSAGESFLCDFFGGIMSSSSSVVMRSHASLLARSPGRWLARRRCLPLPFETVEPQVCFSGLRVEAMAGEALIREDRLDIATETNVFDGLGKVDQAGSGG
jgi:hypothetical protein